MRSFCSVNHLPLKSNRSKLVKFPETKQNKTDNIASLMQVLKVFSTHRIPHLILASYFKDTSSDFVISPDVTFSWASLEKLCHLECY